MDKEEIEKLKQAGEISRKVKDYAKQLVKPGMPLLEIAEKIEAKILELKAKPAFPVNLSINEIAAHATPSSTDSSVASGLLKVDIGVHIDGFVADSAISLDLESSQENKKLIESAQEALDKALEVFKLEAKLKDVGAAIEKSIQSHGFQPIRNLSGHSIEQYDLHAGTTIPNFNNSSVKIIEEGVYAIEPFVTPGFGSVKDGRQSGIYKLIKESNVRDSFAREVLAFIIEEYDTLPFCSRWIATKFGSRALLALKRLEDAGIIHQYAQLVEVSGKKVAQAEHTIIITNEEKIVTT